MLGERTVVFCAPRSLQCAAVGSPHTADRLAQRPCDRRPLADMSTAFAWPAHVGWRALLGGLTNGLRKHIGWLRGDVTESIWSGSSSLRGTALVGVVRRSVFTRR